MLITVDTLRDKPADIAASLSLALEIMTRADGKFTLTMDVPAGTAPGAAFTYPHQSQIPDFKPSDSLPPSPIELGKAPEDTRAASVFAAAPAVPFPPVATATAVIPLPPIPPPPVLTVSSASVPWPNVPAAPVPGAEVDSAGVPHNPALHAGNKAKKQDGTWKARKGNAAPLPPTPPVPVSMPTPPVMVPPPIPPAPLAAQPGPVVGGVAPLAPTDASVPLTFRGVMGKVNAGKAAGKLTQADVDASLVMVGLKADELAPLVLPQNAALLAAFNDLIDMKVST
jgi:hypothetical protein